MHFLHPRDVRGGRVTFSPSKGRQPRQKFIFPIQALPATTELHFPHTSPASHDRVSFFPSKPSHPRQNIHFHTSSASHVETTLPFAILHLTKYCPSQFCTSRENCPSQFCTSFHTSSASHGRTHFFNTRYVRGGRVTFLYYKGRQRR